jgi:Superinfection immunity protein
MFVVNPTICQGCRAPLEDEERLSSYCPRCTLAHNKRFLWRVVFLTATLIVAVILVCYISLKVNPDIGDLALVSIYFSPSIVGCHKRDAFYLFLLNFVLGWTLLGWVVAYI